MTEHHKKFTKAIELITGKTFKDSKNDFDLDFNFDIDNDECLCGKDLNRLFKIVHKDTKKEFIVGSDCITRLGPKYKDKVNAIEYCTKHSVPFGKHKGVKWIDVIKKDMKYIEFVFNNYYTLSNGKEYRGYRLQRVHPRTKLTQKKDVQKIARKERNRKLLLAREDIQEERIQRKRRDWKPTNEYLQNFQ